MSEHLIVLSLGPVQDFISAARRTRDLWYGSELLSDLSKTAARALKDVQAELVFPHESALSDDVLKVSNVILAKLHSSQNPADAAEDAGRKVQKRWEAAAEQAKKQAADLVEEAMWNDQVEDVVEFYAAWVPLNGPSDYKEARLEVMRVLAGRKACRNFVAARGREGVPKSSLDGMRESVLVRGQSREETRAIRRHIFRDAEVEGLSLAQRLQLRMGEELDVVALTKRMASDKAFPSVTRIAADPWIRGVVDDGGEAKESLAEVAGRCKGRPFAAGTGPSYGDKFPYDGAVLFPNRLTTMIAAAKGQGASADECDDYANLLTQEHVTELERLRQNLTIIADGGEGIGGYGYPDPYLAVIVADGDHMGSVISQLEDMKGHQELSRRLAGFASEAGNIVRKCHGCLVYSGGDDILAFLPVDSCLQCARRLYDEFGKSLPSYQDEAGHAPTLSVGIAIGHCLDPLEDLLHNARRAERDAKEPDRNGLAIHLYPRSGAPVKVKGKWDSGLEERMQGWTGMYCRRELPSKAGYDLRSLAKDYGGWPKSQTTDDAIRAEIFRLLQRKRAGGNSLDMAQFQASVASCFLAGYSDASRDEVHPQFHPGVLRLANEWLIARRLARAAQQAAGLLHSEHDARRPA